MLKINVLCRFLYVSEKQTAVMVVGPIAMSVLVPYGKGNALPS
jgi:hypothetical protein